jgi:large subunit ribosomal protein L7/L12
MSSDFDKIIEQLETLNLAQASELVKALEERWGVSAAAPMAMGMPMMAGGGAAAEDAEEQTAFDVVIEDAGGQKIKVIKAVREVNGSLGLKEAKEVVESAPTAVLSGVTKEEAEAAKAKLEEAGAKIAIK